MGGPISITRSDRRPDADCAEPRQREKEDQLQENDAREPTPSTTHVRSKVMPSKSVYQRMTACQVCRWSVNLSVSADGDDHHDREGQRRAWVLTRVLKGERSMTEAAQALGLSERQLWRLRSAFERDGPAGLVHGNRGRASPSELLEEGDVEPTSRLSERVEVCIFDEEVVGSHGTILWWRLVRGPLRCAKNVRTGSPDTDRGPPRRGLKNPIVSVRLTTQGSKRVARLRRCQHTQSRAASRHATRRCGLAGRQDRRHQHTA